MYFNLKCISVLFCASRIEETQIESDARTRFTHSHLDTRSTYMYVAHDHGDLLRICGSLCSFVAVMWLIFSALVSAALRCRQRWAAEPMLSSSLGQRWRQWPTVPQHLQCYLFVGSSSNIHKFILTTHITGDNSFILIKDERPSSSPCAFDGLSIPQIDIYDVGKLQFIKHLLNLLPSALHHGGQSHVSLRSH